MSEDAGFELGYVLTVREGTREFQERLTVAVKEDEYCEVPWEGIDKIGSCREVMVGR